MLIQVYTYIYIVRIVQALEEKKPLAEDVLKHNYIA